jgi:DNA-directed RNA polymerase I subunit RPA1
LLPKKLQDLNDSYNHQPCFDDNRTPSDQHDSQVKEGKARPAVYLTAYQVRKHLQLLFEKESLLCTMIFARDAALAEELLLEKIQSERDVKRLFSLQPKSPVSCDIFYLHALLVPPNRFRPPSMVNGQMFENPTNTHLSNVLRRCGRIRDLMARAALNGKENDSQEETTIVNTLQHRMGLFDKEWHALQLDVIGLVDNTKAVRARGSSSTALPAGVRQVLERKEGLLRKHLMVGPHILT